MIRYAQCNNIIFLLKIVSCIYKKCKSTLNIFYKVEKGLECNFTFSALSSALLVE